MMSADNYREQEMLTTVDVAGRLGYSEATVRRLCEEGKFEGDESRKIPGAWRAGLGSHWRIPAAAFDHFVAQTKPKVVKRGGAVRKG